MEIKSSLEWYQVEHALHNRILLFKKHEHRSDAFRLVHNISNMITKLSKLELEARRSANQSLRRVNEQLALINAEINSIEQWATLLLLSN